MEFSAILGWVATILFTICYIPQIIKIRKVKSVEGLSFLLLLMSFIANIIALCYSILIKQPPLQFKYVLGIVFVGICLALYIKTYKSNKPH